MALRPTSDRLRETLFNVLGASVAGSTFVDLFAGTGAIGIEALSRGARRVFFVENHAAAVKLIRENLKSLRINDGIEAIAMDAIRGLKQFAMGDERADLVFMDPPYARAEEYERVLEFVDAAAMLAPESLVIAEHAKKIELPEKTHSLERTRVLIQGDSALSFYRPQPD